MLHLVAGGQAGNINLHVLLSLSLKIRIPAAQGAADIEIVRQFLAKGGKIPVAGQQLGLFGDGQARQLTQLASIFCILPPSRSVRPMLPWNTVSPTKR